MGKTSISLIKHSFFDHSSEHQDAPNLSFKNDDFDLNQLRAEFSSLYQLFLSNEDCWQAHPEVALYTNHLCEILIQYYQTDYVGAELKKLQEQQQKLNHLLQQINPHELNSFSQFVITRLKNNFRKYQDSLGHLAEFRENVRNLNTNRSYFGYSRSLALSLLPYLQNSAISESIRKFNELIGNQFSVAESINLLNESRQPTAILGIILFSLRFMIQLILTLKHIIYASLNEKLSVKKVAQQEFEKRGFMMISDLVWAVGGLLTVFNNCFHITATSSSLLTFCFLTFDTLLFFAQWLFEAHQYHSRLQELVDQQENAADDELVIIKRQVNQLNDEWEAQSWYYAINIVGANLLATSFAFTLLYTGPLALAGMAFLSMLGNALYNTSIEYKLYQQAKIALKREKTNAAALQKNDEHHSLLIDMLKTKCDQKNIEFWNTLTFNVSGLAFIITAASVSWPIALTLTVSYMGYQLNKDYQKQLKLDLQEMPCDIYRFIEADNSLVPQL